MEIQNIKFYWIFFVWSSVTVAILCDENVDVKLTPSATEVVHYVNESYIVSCEAIDSRLRWFNPLNEVVGDRPDRVHTAKIQGKLALVFTSISMDDNGTWLCEAEKGNQKISFNMNVNVPISFVDTPNVQRVKEYEGAVIKCMATGIPEPTISWYYNGQPIDINTDNIIKAADGLVIKNVTKAYSGEYTCKAYQISAALNNVKEQTIRFNILHEPILLEKRESADIQYGYLKGFVNITCEAHAEPPAEFTWYRKHEKLNSEQIITADHISVLQLYLNDSKSFGEYVCEAKNDFGTLKRTITLVNGTKPVRPIHLQFRGINSNMVDIDVGARRTHPSKPMDVNAYRFEVISNNDFQNNGRKWNTARVVVKDFTDDITYLIDNLSPNTTYLVRVASLNPAGRSDWQGPEEFKTNAKKPLGLPKDPLELPKEPLVLSKEPTGMIPNGDHPIFIKNHLIYTLALIIIYNIFKKHSFISFHLEFL